MEIDLLIQNQIRTTKLEPKMASHFDPYDMNGGSVVAISGDNFAIIGSDTRLSQSYNILSRNVPKISTIGNDIAIGMSGFHGDIITFKKKIKSIVKIYKYKNLKDISVTSFASMVSKQLYYNRFFPYYVYNLIAGIDKDGVGCVFGYDPVGSYERLNYGCVGSASKLILPMLDNQVALKNQNLDEKKSITLEKALKLIHDVFISASERDIYTGDFLNIYIIQKGKFEEKTIELRRD